MGGPRPKVAFSPPVGHFVGGSAGRGGEGMRDRDGGVGDVMDVELMDVELMDVELMDVELPSSTHLSEVCMYMYVCI